MKARSRQAQTTASAIKLAIFVIVSVVVTLSVMQTIRPLGGSGREVHAIFSSAGRLAANDQVRVAGVVVGRVKAVKVTQDGRADITFTVEPDLPLTEGTKAQVKYLNLVGDRYLSLTSSPGAALPAGKPIAIDNTQPPLDLNDLFNGFKPLFAALSPKDVNALSNDIVQTLQGEGNTIEGLLRHTASLTSTIARRDESIGTVVDNLNVVLGGLDQRHTKLEELVVQLNRFVGGLAEDRKAIGSALTNIDSLTEVTSDLLTEARPALKEDVAQLHKLAKTLNEPANVGEVDHALTHTPTKLSRIIRTASYGSFFNYYFCDLRLRMTEQESADGLQGLLGGKVLSFSAHDSSPRCNP